MEQGRSGHRAERTGSRKHVYQAVQKRIGGKVVNQALCNAGGRYVYKLVVLGPTGQVTKVTVDAKTGQF